MPLTSDAAQIVTRAQSFHAAVKPMFVNIKPQEAPDLSKLRPGEAGAYVLWLLGTKIPRLARGNRLQEATGKLALAQGIIVGLGLMSRHDVHLTTTVPPEQVGQRRSHRIAFTSLTV